MKGLQQQNSATKQIHALEAKLGDTDPAVPSWQDFKAGAIEGMTMLESNIERLDNLWKETRLRVLGFPPWISVKDLRAVA